MPMTAETVRYQVTGVLTGTFWWPIGESWCKPLMYEWTRAAHPHAFCDQHRDLREALVHVTDDGDSASACRIADGTLTVIRERRTVNGSVTRTRSVPLERFTDAADMVDREWAGWPDSDEKED